MPLDEVWWEDYEDNSLIFLDFIFKGKDILEGMGDKTPRLATSCHHALDAQLTVKDTLTEYEEAWLDNLEVPL